jgi:hypothetical protein
MSKLVNDARSIRSVTPFVLIRVNSWIVFFALEQSDPRIHTN